MCMSSEKNDHESTDHRCFVRSNIVLTPLYSLDQAGKIWDISWKKFENLDVGNFKQDKFREL